MLIVLPSKVQTGLLPVLLQPEISAEGRQGIGKHMQAHLAGSLCVHAVDLCPDLGLALQQALGLLEALQLSDLPGVGLLCFLLPAPQLQQRASKHH